MNLQHWDLWSNYLGKPYDAATIKHRKMSERKWLWIHFWWPSNKQLSNDFQFTVSSNWDFYPFEFIFIFNIIWVFPNWGNSMRSQELQVQGYFDIRLILRLVTVDKISFIFYETHKWPNLKIQ